MPTRLIRTAALALVAASSGFCSAVLLSGNSMPASSTLTDNLALLPGNTYTVVSPAAFASTPQAGYDLVWLDGFSLYNDLSSLVPYLNGGGRVLVQNPGFGSEPLSQYPDGAGITATFSTHDTVRLLMPGDLLNLHLTAGALSGWGPSAYGNFVSVTSAFLVLSDDGVDGEAITIRRNGGPGVLVYTQQGISQYLQNHVVTADAAQLQFIDNILAAPEPSTALLLVGGGLLVIARRRSR